MKARFKDASLQSFYELCRKHGQDMTTRFYNNGRPNRGAGHRSAYWNGRSGLRSSWPRNTFAHAAWAAGQDDLRDHGAVEGSEWSRHHV